MLEHQLRILIYWIQERIRIEEKKRAGHSPPWTEDPILQSWFFTNPYREWDKVTVWFRENVRERFRSDLNVFHSAALKTFFPKISTLEALKKAGVFDEWSIGAARQALLTQDKPFSPAYIISGKLSEYGTKLETCIRITDLVYQARKDCAQICKVNSLEAAFNYFKTFRFIGAFLSYEIVTDLRHTDFLCNAVDIMTWANPGPGAKRGIHRLLSGSPGNLGLEYDDYIRYMRELLTSGRLPEDFEMREVEHSLCEFDKYARCRETGRIKRRYQGY